MDALIQAMARLGDTSPRHGHVGAGNCEGARKGVGEGQTVGGEGGGGSKRRERGGGRGKPLSRGQVRGSAARPPHGAGAKTGHVARKGKGKGDQGRKGERAEERDDEGRRILDLSHDTRALGLQEMRDVIASAPPSLVVLL
jgi:hypothetical protein